MQDAKKPVEKVWNFEAMMERMLQDQDMADIIIAHYLKDMPAQMKELNKCINDKDINLVQNKSHSIKGAAAMIGAEAFGKIASGIEKDAINGDIDAIRVMQGLLKEKYNELEKLLTEYLKKQ